MAIYPKLVADVVEKIGRATTVTEVIDPSPTLRLIRFASPALTGVPWEPCQVTAFRVGKGQFRHYTPSRLDAEAGTGEIQVVFHSAARSAPGERLLERLEPGARVTWCGLEAPRAFRWAPHPRILVLGDATTLGLWRSFLEHPAVVLGQISVVGAVEVAPGDEAGAASIVPGLSVVTEDAIPGAALDAWLGGPGGLDSLQMLAETNVYLAGHGRSLQRLRAQLLARGAQRGRIRTHVYWTDHAKRVRS